MPNHDKEPVTTARRFLTFCLAVLAGIVLLYLSIQLLSQFWGWLVLLALVAIAIYVGFLVIQARRNRW